MSTLKTVGTSPQEKPFWMLAHNEVMEMCEREDLSHHELHELLGVVQGWGHLRVSSSNPKGVSKAQVTLAWVKACLVHGEICEECQVSGFNSPDSLGARICDEVGVVNTGHQIMFLKELTSLLGDLDPNTWLNLLRKAYALGISNEVLEAVSNVRNGALAATAIQCGLTGKRLRPSYGHKREWDLVEGDLEALRKANLTLGQAQVALTLATSVADIPELINAVKDIYTV
jgi:hypothetical protein